MNENKYSVIHSDCLDFLNLQSDESIDLIYLDPPFFTQKTQRLSNRRGKEYQFEDTWESLDSYLQYMEKRLIEMHRTLKSTGSIFLHCDDKASHYLRVIMDRVFGSDNFRSEIIWTYRRWSNAKKGLLGAHQTIFFYSKSNNFKFNRLMQDYSLTTNVDQILQERSRDTRNKSSYKLDENGNPVFGMAKKGVPLSDVWEIPFLNPKAKERTGYPTQKPVNLMKRIIELATDENDVVLDPFCGSGTTLIASKILNRSAIGVDINEEAIRLTNARLDNPCVSESALLTKGKDSFNNKDDKVLARLQSLGCTIVQRNKGIDGFLPAEFGDSSIPVKIQKEHESLEEAIRLLDNAAKKRNCEKAILIRTNDMQGMFGAKIPVNIIVIEDLSFQLSHSGVENRQMSLCQ